MGFRCPHALGDWRLRDRREDHARLRVTIKLLVAMLLALIARAEIDGAGLAVDLSIGVIVLILVGALCLWHQG
jgi:hypothetical protein